MRMLGRRAYLGDAGDAPIVCAVEVCEVRIAHHALGVGARRRAELKHALHIARVMHAGKGRKRTPWHGRRA